MSKIPLKIPPEFDNASTQERIEFVGRLWDEILRSGDDVPSRITTRPSWKNAYAPTERIQSQGSLGPKSGMNF